MQATGQGSAGSTPIRSSAPRSKADLERFRGRRLFNSQWDRVVVCETTQAPAAGKTVAALAATQAKHPLDAFLDLRSPRTSDTLFTAELLNTDEQAVGRLIADDASHVALSDAGARISPSCATPISACI
jgi:N-acyl-D-aspartate/D-glutamate deacylase